MYKNPLKEKMQQQVPVSGCMVQACVPSIVEICGLVGFDFVFLDAEHGAISPKDCEELVRAAVLEDAKLCRDRDRVLRLCLRRRDRGGRRRRGPIHLRARPAPATAVSFHRTPSAA